MNKRLEETPHNREHQFYSDFFMTLINRLFIMIVATQSDNEFH